ncbi:hypothetical protein BC829DRAFT_382848 [Chytridium lagenaria]|nr:hypothetical protein BC829DRAFT_382848 [Chytridium lagenaria]
MAGTMTAAKMLAAQNAASQPSPTQSLLSGTHAGVCCQLGGHRPAHLVSKPLSEVVLDALVALLGVDIAGSLEVTNYSGDESEGAAADEIDGAEYQLQMLRCLRKLNFDANSVGLYVSTHLGSFWNQTIVENQYHYQKMYAQSVLIVYDHTRTVQGNLSLRALRLTDTFMELFKDKKFTMEALHAHKLTPSGIFESLPVRVRNSYLLNALLQQLEEDITSTLGVESYLERHLEYLGDTVDEHGQEQWRWQGWNRSLQKEQAKSAQISSKKRQENAARVASGLAPLHSEEDILTPTPALAKILSTEPSRLETLIISNQIDTYCKQMYLTKAVARLK